MELIMNVTENNSIVSIQHFTFQSHGPEDNSEILKSTPQVKENPSVCKCNNIYTVVKLMLLNITVITFLIFLKD